MAAAIAALIAVGAAEAAAVTCVIAAALDGALSDLDGVPEAHSLSGMAPAETFAADEGVSD